MFENGFEKFMEIEDSHFRRSKKERLSQKLRIEEFKNINF